MMYKNQLCLAIKHNGKILRENKDMVSLPFGSEFSVLVKNLNNRRVKFKLHIDGTDVLDGTDIIVNANSETEIKRFIRNGNMNEGNSFKFIERTQSIEDSPRGIKIEDGIIKIEFWFEQEQEYITKSRGFYPQYNPFYEERFGRTFSSSTNCATSTSMNSVKLMSNTLKSTETLSDIGITVPGSIVEQKFTPVYGFNSETTSHVIVLRMVGKIGSTEITTPITVHTKQKCITCGRLNKATSNFCVNCGTALTLV